MRSVVVVEQSERPVPALELAGQERTRERAYQRNGVPS